MPGIRNEVQNLFNSGIVLDFSPTVMKNTMLSDALNATLLTGNGNEMSLQQDMGNGRVETAYLPEGYVPVGTCEYGDIIYVVSYNPLEDKSQIGCFPSPERNISSEEVCDVEQNITSDDFQYKTGESPNGRIKSMNVKKIVYGNNYLEPGDKYIIYEQDVSGNDDGEVGCLYANKDMLSDYGSTAHRHESWPKMLKINVVSIEDSGKIVNLNSSVKWYDNDYYLAYLALQKDTGKPDIDSYRSLVSSAYSVFQSKVSGKLALLVELESISGFSCAYEIYSKRVEHYIELEEVKKSEDMDDDADDEEGNEAENDGTFELDGVKMVYDIYFYTSWTTDHYDVNPTGFVFMKSDWIGDIRGGRAYRAFQSKLPEDEGGGYSAVSFGEEENVETIPLKSALKMIDEAGNDGGTSGGEDDDAGYDYDKIYKYTRTYKIEKPSEDYDTYIGEESYYAKIDDIIDWCKYKVDDEVKYEAFKYDKEVESAEEVRGRLRNVTRIARLIDDETGEPDAKIVTDEGLKKIDEEEYHGERIYNYYYNIDNIIKGQDGGIVYCTKSNIGEDIELNPVVLNDDVVVNTFNSDVPMLVRKGYEIVVSDYVHVKQTDDESGSEEYAEVEYKRDISGLKWAWTVAPVMPYGVLEHYSLSGIIDFSLVGTGQIRLNEWRYYNSDNVCTLTWGLEAYVEQNKGISELCMDFYDNQGMAASWHVTDKTSYSGSFTDTIVLSQRFSSYKLNNIDAYGEQYVHAGTSNESGTVWLDANNKALGSDPGPSGYGPYDDDSGTLYPNMLYLVRITVKYGVKDLLGGYSLDGTSEYRTFWRWYWSNGMFNDQYYSITDFDVLMPRIDLDFSVTIDTRGGETFNPVIVSHSYYRRDINGLKYSETSVDGTELLYKTLGSCVYHINQDGGDDVKGNVLVTSEPLMAEAYDTFNFNQDMLDLLSVSVVMGRSSITKSVDAPSVVRTDSSRVSVYDDCLQPVCPDSADLCSHFTKPDPNEHPGVNGTEGWDYSGYACRGYGVSNSQITSGYLELLGVENGIREEYYSDLDTIHENSRDVQDIWEESDSYGQYLDAFSLNLCEYRFVTLDPDDPDMEKYSYYDQNGNEQVLEHYQIYESNMRDMRGNGMRLTLAGTAQSKIFATGVSEDKDAKTLRSVIHDALDENYNSPMMLGLFVGKDYPYSTGDPDYGASPYEHQYDHMYFDNVITWTAGKSSRNARLRYKSAGVYDISGYDPDTSDGYERNTKEGDGSDADHVGAWSEDYLKTTWNNLLGDSKPFNALVIARSDASNTECNYVFSDRGGFYNMLSGEFHSGSCSEDNKERLYDNMRYAPYWDPNNDTHHSKYDSTSSWKSNQIGPIDNVHCLLAYDKKKGYYVPLNDWFLGKYYSGPGGSVPNYKIFFSNMYCGYSSGDDIVAMTLADMVGGLFSQLYVVDTDLPSDYVILNGLAYPEAYTEYWNKDMVFSVEFDSEGTDHSANDLIMIHRQPVSMYVERVMNNSGTDEEDVSKYNVDMQIYGIKKDVVFQYAVQYDLVDLRYGYEEYESQRNRLVNSIIDSPDSSQETVAFSANVTENTLYCMTSGGNVSEFGESSVIYYPKGFVVKDTDNDNTGDEVCMIRSDNILSRTSFSDLVDIIQYKKGKVTLEDLENINGNGTYYIGWKGASGVSESDSPKLSDLPDKSIFHEYNV